jgi:hypothetical protein
MNKANLAQIYAGVKHAPGDPNAIFKFPAIRVSTVHDHTTLLSRDDFQGLLLVKIDLQLDIMRIIRSQNLEEQLDEITAMLKDELANQDEPFWPDAEIGNFKYPLNRVLLCNSGTREIECVSIKSFGI